MTCIEPKFWIYFIIFYLILSLLDVRSRIIPADRIYSQLNLFCYNLSGTCYGQIVALHFFASLVIFSDFPVIFQWFVIFALLTCDFNVILWFFAGDLFVIFVCDYLWFQVRCTKQISDLPLVSTRIFNKKLRIWPSTESFSKSTNFEYSEFLRSS